MKTFSLKVILFNSILILFFCFFLVLESFFLNSSDYFKLSNQTKYLVFGHSHPECAFNDSLINNFANFGYSAESYFYTYFKAKKLLQNNKQIEAVFIEFTNNQILKEWDTTWTWDDINLQEFFPKYFPFMGVSDLRTLVFGNYLGVLNNLSTTVINNFYQSVKIVSGSANVKKDGKYGGFIYLPYSRVDSLIENTQPVISNNEFEVAKINLVYLSKIIDLCRQYNVKIFLIRSPIHSEWPELNKESRYREILTNVFKDTEFLDFKNFPIQNFDYGDLSHLNGKGARKFSTFFDELLKSGLLQQDKKQEFINGKVQNLMEIENNSQRSALSLLQD